MLRNIGILVTVFVLFVALAAGVYAAAPAAGDKPAMNEQKHDTTKDQTICPVSGEPVSKDSKITYTYKGTVYRFCCTDCREEFKKDPEKYIKQMQEREKSETIKK